MFIAAEIGGSYDHEDEAGEDVVGVVDMRITFDNERVTALFAYSLQRLGFSDYVNLVAGMMCATCTKTPTPTSTSSAAAIHNGVNAVPGQ